jgi:hypothetical protein
MCNCFRSQPIEPLTNIENSSPTRGLCRGLYIVPKIIFIPPPLPKMIFSFSPGSYCALFALILPYVALIFPFYFLFYHHHSPFFLFFLSSIFWLHFPSFFSSPFHIPPPPQVTSVEISTICECRQNICRTYASTVP